MKILAIRGENLASLFGFFEVNLDGSPIREAGLFAITGPTGAGKSTLLDALCLALFGQTPRRAGRSGFQMESNRKGGVGDRDARGILARGAGEGHAEVDFRGADGLDYRARWEVRRARKKPDGALQQAKHSLARLPGNDVLSSHRVQETRALIEEALGLDFDRFRRSVLLAQGEFHTFLKAKGSERGELLESITGSDLYRLLSIAAFERGSQEEAELKSLVDSQGAVTLLEPEERRDLEGRVSRVDAERAKVLEAKTALERERDWWARELELRGEVCEAYSALSRDLEGLESSPSDPGESSLDLVTTGELSDAEVLELGARAREVRDRVVLALRDVEALDATILARSRDQEALVLERADEQAVLDGSTRTLERHREDHRVAASALAGHRRWIEEHGRDVRLAEEWPRNEGRLAEAAGIRHELDSAEAERRERGRVLEELELERRKAAQEREKCKSALGRATLALEASLKASEGIDRAVLGREREGLLARRDALADLGRIVDQAQEIHGRVWERVGLRDASVADVERFAAASKQASAKAGELRIALTEAEGALARARSTMDLEDRRAELVAGEACPLCGSKEHPHADHSLVERLFEEQRDRVGGLKKELAGLDRQEGDAVRGLQLARHKLEVAEKELAEGRRSYADLVERWERLPAAPEQVPLPPLDFEANGIEGGSTGDSFAKALGFLETERRRVAEKREEARVREEAADRVERGLKGAQAVREEALGAFEDSRAAAAEVERTHTSEATAIRECERRIEREKKRWGILRADLEAWLTLGGEADDTDSRRLEGEISGLSVELEGRMKAVIERRRAEARSEKSVQSTQLAVERAESEGKQAQARLAKLRERLDRLGKELEDSRRKRAELDGGRFRDRSTEEVRRLQQSVSDGLTRLEERLLGKRRLEESGTPQRDAGSVERVLAEVRVREAEVDDRRVKLRGELQADDQQRNRLAGLEAQIEARRRDSEPWIALKKMIGSSDGASFRNFAQGLTFQNLLVEANAHLKRLSNRYSLARVPGEDLEMQVVDQHMAGEARSIHGLSGGEGFLVSLALALGLASLTGERTRIESLFIDEGFGTLDGETLEVAISALDVLRGEGRTIGVISHVGGLAERLGVEVRIEPSGSGRSRLVKPSP